MDDLLSKPRIGVSGPDRKGFLAWRFAAFALWLQGAKAIRITPSNRDPKLPLDGLILGGGSDLDPELYDYPAHHTNTVIDQERDVMELDLLGQATQAGLPVLGICRGAQLINIFFGGTLYKNVYEAFPGIHHKNSPFPVRHALIRTSSRLSHIMGRDRSWINSLHLQAVDRLGADLSVAAQDENGIVQGIEHTKAAFIIGVQWHPEYLSYLRGHRRLFAALADAARDFRKSQ